MGFQPAYTRLVSALKAAGGAGSSTNILIQPHDDPDHDAVAASFGLHRLLSRAGFSPRIRHRGRVRSHSLLAMVEEFGIPLERVHSDAPEYTDDAPCVIIDGSPAHANAKPLSSRLLGFIDHHPNPGINDCPFIDNRVSYGACASIIADYWMDSGMEPDKACATALLMGIQMDTDFLSRRVSPADLDAHRRLFFTADWEFSTRVMKGSLSTNDLPALRLAAQQAKIEGDIFFTEIPLDCTQEVISIIADFFLRLKEITLTVIVEAGGGRYHVSVRSKSPELSAAAIVKRALIGIGRGGGHDHMAGGVIEPSLYPGGDALLVRFVEAVEAAQENQ